MESGGGETSSSKATQPQNKDQSNPPCPQASSGPAPSEAFDFDSADVIFEKKETEKELVIEFKYEYGDDDKEPSLKFEEDEVTLRFEVLRNDKSKLNHVRYTFPAFENTPPIAKLSKGRLETDKKRNKTYCKFTLSKEKGCPMLKDTLCPESSSS